MIEISPSSKSVELTPSNSESPKPLDELDRRVKVAAEELVKIKEASPYADYTIAELFEVIDKLEADPKAALEVEQAFRELAQRPASLKTIEHLVKRRGKLISKAERQLMNALKKQLPDLNRALTSYELLQRETDRIDLARFTPRELQLGHETFPVYDTAGADYRFLVHSAGLNEGPIEDVKKKRMKSGFLCASVISNELPYFYRPEANYAMVLSADPRNIVATTRQDAFTPYTSKNPLTHEFYRFYQRLQLLTGYIELLFRESGASQDHPTDQFSRMNRLLALKQEMPLDLETEQLIDQLLSTYAIKYEGTAFERYTEMGVSLIKLFEIIKHLKSNPNARALSDCRRCKALILEIQKEMDLFHHHIHPIIGVGELLAQTPFQAPHLYNSSGRYPYNEVNLDLATHYSPHRDPVEVRAVMIHPESFQQRPEWFRDVLKNAKARGIPILLRSDPEPTPHAIRMNFLRSIERCDLDNINELMDSYAIDGAFAGKALLKSLEKYDDLTVIQLLLKRRNDIPEELVIQAFDFARKNGKGYLAETIYELRQEMLKERALELLNEEPVNWGSRVLSKIITLGFPLDPAKAGKALLGFFKAENPEAVRAILSKYLNDLPEDDLQVFFQGISFLYPSFRQTSYLTEEAQKLFSQRKGPN